MVKYCPNCGEKHMDDAKFCKKCGATFKGNAQAAGVPEPPVYEKSYTGHIIVGYILDIIFPLLGLILGIYLMTRKDSETANTQGKYVLIVAILIMAISILSRFI